MALKPWRHKAVESEAVVVRLIAYVKVRCDWRLAKRGAGFASMRGKRRIDIAGCITECVMQRWQLQRPKSAQLGMYNGGTLISPTQAM